MIFFLRNGGKLTFSFILFKILIEIFNPFKTYIALFVV